MQNMSKLEVREGSPSSFSMRKELDRLSKENGGRTDSEWNMLTGSMATPGTSPEQAGGPWQEQVRSEDVHADHREGWSLRKQAPLP